jgi:hypothetical protein
MLQAERVSETSEDLNHLTGLSARNFFNFCLRESPETYASRWLDAKFFFNNLLLTLLNIN